MHAALLLLRALGWRAWLLSMHVAVSRHRNLASRLTNGTHGKEDRRGRGSEAALLLERKKRRSFLKGLFKLHPNLSTRLLGSNALREEGVFKPTLFRPGTPPSSRVPLRSQGRTAAGLQRESHLLDRGASLFLARFCRVRLVGTARENSFGRPDRRIRAEEGPSLPKQKTYSSTRKGSSHTHCLEMLSNRDTQSKFE